MKAIRNIGVLAHVDAGKTSITERMLFLAGLKREAGAVDDGTTATDYLSVERLHGITVKSAAVRFEWDGSVVHLIDTPGHVDFGNEVDRALRILDGAVIALCAVSGIQARTEVIARACAARNLPRLYFVNKMDRAGADFPGIIDDLRAGLEPDAAALQSPIVEGQKWTGVVDLVRMEAHRFADGQDNPGIPLAQARLSEPSTEAALAARARLIEKIAENDEEVLSLYASDRAISSDVLARAAAEAVKACRLAPVLCGSAFVEASIRLLLDAVIALLPSPAEARIPQGIDPRTQENSLLSPSATASLAAFVFKTLRDSAGDLYAWTRVWCGTVAAGRKVFDARSSRDVIVKKLFGIQADSLTELKEAGPGEVVALKAADVESGASLCERGSPIIFEALEIPEPVVSQVFEPQTLQDLTALRRALDALALEDLSLRVSEEKETGRFEVAGQGELHLDIVAERLRRDFGLRLRTGNPRVNCRERLLRGASAREEFDRDFGGERIKVSVEVAVKTHRDRTANEVLLAPGLRLQPPHLAAARRGAESAMGVGPSQGWPLEGAKLTIIDLAPPGGGTGRNGEIAVEAASALAVRRALLEAGSEILEPVMRIDIDCPDEHFGPVLNAISARGGRVESVEEGAGMKSITALAPLGRLFGFAGELRSMSRGKAQFQARFGSYEPLR